jgi:hypothetical protein
VEEAAAPGQVSASAAAFQVAAVVALAPEARMDPEAPAVAEVRAAELVPQLMQETCGVRQRSVAAAAVAEQG